MISGSLAGFPVCTWLIRLIDAGGDPGVFCYRMGIDIFSAGRERFFVPAPWVAHGAAVKRNQDACPNLFSTFSTRFSTQKD
jgi:hypothetical protein